MATMTRLSTLALFATLLTLASIPSTTEAVVVKATVAKYLSTSHQFGLFYSLVELSPAAKAAIEAPGPKTVFAPRNKWLKNHAGAQLATLIKPENAALLTDVLLFHIINGSTVLSTDLVFPSMVASAEGSPLHFTSPGKNFYVEMSRIKKPDIAIATDGVVHQIEGLLIPQEPVEAPAPAPSSMDAGAAPTPGPGPAPAPAPTSAGPKLSVGAFSSALAVVGAVVVSALF